MSVFVTALSREQVFGTIAWSVVGLEDGHLRGMAVLPLTRGSGMASQLLSGAESELQQRKCARVTLHVTEPLLRAVRFYEKHGYRVRKNQGLLWDAVDRISKNLALRSLDSSRSGRQEFLLLGGLQHLTILDATGGQHFDFGFLLARHL
jgi:predicted N-acetyltransferase YhbS